MLCCRSLAEPYPLPASGALPPSHPSVSLPTSWNASLTDCLITGFGPQPPKHPSSDLFQGNLSDHLASWFRELCSSDFVHLSHCPLLHAHPELLRLEIQTNPSLTTSSCPHGHSDTF